MSNVKFMILIIGLFSVIFVNNLSAKMYKWIDENGITHFSEIPPQDKEIDKVFNTATSKGDETKKINESEKMDDVQKNNEIHAESKDINISKSDIN